MINVLIPAMGKSLFFKDSYFPKPMLEIAGETMLERVVNNYAALDDKRFIFVLDKKDCQEFHLDSSTQLLTGENTKIIKLDNHTAGALCSCLMAIESVNDEAPLIISNCDQVIDVDYADVRKYFEERNAHAGVIAFDSIHPRWSYAKIKDGEVVEVAEKRPLSKHAIAGCYYYRSGRDFIQAAKKVVLKDNNYNGQYYISSTINEIILMGKKVLPYFIKRAAYHSFYSPEKIKEYDNVIKEKYYENK